MLKDLVGRQKANEIVVEIEDLMETIQTLGWKDIRPWNEFFAMFKVPQWNQKHLEERITTNFLHYRSNYFVIAVALFIFQIVFSPVMIFTALLIGIFYVVAFTLVKNNFRVGDLVITLKMKQYIFFTIAGLTLVLSGALTRLAWFLVSAVSLIGGHLLFRPRNMTAKANKVYEEMKMNGYDMKHVFQFSSLTGGNNNSNVGGGGSSSSSASSGLYNNDKPSYSSVSPASEKKDIENPVIESEVEAAADSKNNQDDYQPYVGTTGFSSNLSSDNNANNMRKRGAGEFNDYKHK
jgi:hypothetical protein